MGKNLCSFPFDRSRRVSMLVQRDDEELHLRLGVRLWVHVQGAHVRQGNLLATQLPLGQQELALSFSAV